MSVFFFSYRGSFVVVDVVVYLNLRIQFLNWNERGSCIQVPKLFPLLLLHPLARRPGQRDLLSVQPKLVQVLQSPGKRRLAISKRWRLKENL